MSAHPTQAAIHQIREALAKLPPDALKPWVNLDHLPYIHASDDPKASAWGTPVVGRFDYLDTMQYMLSCHPPAMSIILAELDRLSASPVPEGMKLVPIEPTPEMLSRAGTECGAIGAGSCGEHVGVDWDDFRAVWQSMLAAAPTTKD